MKRFGLTLLAALSLHATAYAQSVTAWGTSGWGYWPALPLPAWFETRAQSFPLGPQMSAEKTYACDVRIRPAVQCVLLGWRPRGFIFGSRPDLERAITFSGDGHGRVIASTERDVVYSDDRGRSWQHASWNGVVRPQVIAMDPVTRFGIAAADGAVHVTNDGGASWSFLRELPSRRILQTVVAGRNALLADGRGGLWAVVQGGEFNVVSEGDGTASFLSGLPQFAVSDGAIVASDAQGRSVRVDPRGSIERSAASTLWGR